MTASFAGEGNRFFRPDDRVVALDKGTWRDGHACFQVTSVLAVVQADPPDLVGTADRSNELEVGDREQRLAAGYVGVEGLAVLGPPIALKHCQRAVVRIGYERCQQGRAAGRINQDRTFKTINAGHAEPGRTSVAAPVEGGRRLLSVQRYLANLYESFQRNVPTVLVSCQAEAGFRGAREGGNV